MKRYEINIIHDDDDKALQEALRINRGRGYSDMETLRRILRAGLDVAMVSDGILGDEWAKKMRKPGRKPQKKR
jgi:hypothetical protein